MKKLLMALVLLGTTALGVSNVNAQVIDLNDIDTNTYIIGDRVYELNKHIISIYDVVAASNEYAINHKGELAPIYYLGQRGNGDLYLLEVTGSVDQTTGEIPYEEIENIDSIFPGSKINATAINNSVLEDYAKEEIAPKIEEFVKALNDSAKEFGFNSITFEDNTITFDIANLNSKLEDYQPKEAVKLFKELLASVVEGRFNLDTVVTKDLKDATAVELAEIAADVIEYLVGDNSLTYGSLVGKSVTATITYENEGNLFADDYTLKFVYDDTNVNEDKEEIINKVVDSLSDSANEYGMSSVTYKAGKLTFNMFDLTRKLADYNVVNAKEIFTSLLEGAMEVELLLDETVTKDVTNLSNQLLAEMAAEILDYLVEDSDFAYSSVVGKSVTARVTFNKGGYIYTEEYVLEFVYDIAAEKDVVLNDVVSDMDTVAKANPEYGFSSVTYDDANHVATFTVSDPTVSILDAKDILPSDFFKENLEGITKISYEYLGEKVTRDIVLDGVQVSANELSKIALELIEEAFGEDDLVIGSLVGKTIAADLTYEVDGVETVVTYNIKFM